MKGIKSCYTCFTRSAERNKMLESRPILFRFCIDLYRLYWARYKRYKLY